MLHPTSEDERMTRRVWACENCGWEWPLATEPPEGAECNNCGGPIEEVARSLVATMDLIEEVVPRPPRCKDCGGIIRLWADGLHHDDRANDHDHDPRPDDGKPEDVRDLRAPRG